MLSHVNYYFQNQKYLELIYSRTVYILSEDHASIQVVIDAKGDEVFRKFYLSLYFVIS